MGRKGDFNTSKPFEPPQADLTPGRVTRDAKILYNSNMRQLMKLAEEQLAEGNRDATGGYGTLDDSGIKSAASRQALKGVQAQINSAWTTIRREEKMDVGDPKRREARKYALVMLQNMVNKYNRNS